MALIQKEGCQNHHSLPARSRAKVVCRYREHFGQVYTLYVAVIVSVSCGVGYRQHLIRSIKLKHADERQLLPAAPCAGAASL